MARLSKEHHEAQEKAQFQEKTPARRISRFREIFSNRKSFSPITDGTAVGDTPTPSIRSPSVRPSFEIVGLLPSERVSTQNVTMNSTIQEPQDVVPAASYAPVSVAAAPIPNLKQTNFAMNPPLMPNRGQQRHSLPAELPATTISEDKKLKLKFSQEEFKYIATAALTMMPPSPEQVKIVDIPKKVRDLNHLQIHTIDINTKGANNKEIDNGTDTKEKAVEKEVEVKGKGKGKAVKKDATEKKSTKASTRKRKAAQIGDEKQDLSTDEDEIDDSYKSDFSDADTELDTISQDTKMILSALKELPDPVFQLKFNATLTVPAFRFGVYHEDAIVPSIWYGLRDILAETAPGRITVGPLKFTSRGAALGLYAMSVSVYTALFFLAVCRGPIEIFASALRICYWLIGYMVVMHHSPWVFRPEHDIVMAPLVGLGGKVRQGDVASLVVGMEVETPDT